jgi:hypothetical protein
MTDYLALIRKAPRIELPHKPLRTEPPKTPEPSAADPESGVPYAQWKAEMLNRIFAEHGVLKQPGRISPATIEDGLCKVLPARGPIA